MESIAEFIASISTARVTHTPKSTALCPPANLCTMGPTNLATTVNGAKLNSRNSSTFGRASVGLIERKTESARDTAMVASPATTRACNRESRLSGDGGGSPVPRPSSPEVLTGRC